MVNLLKSEIYKLFHSWYFWGLAVFNLFLSSVLLVDSSDKTGHLFFASLYNVPILSFLAIIFSALFVGNDFTERTLQTSVSAGYPRGKILLVKMVICQIAVIFMLVLPLIVHGLIGVLILKQTFEPMEGNFNTMISVMLSLFAMCMVPFFFGFLFKDTGKTLVVPMIIFFLMILLLNGQQASQLSQILPMGQLRLIALQQTNILSVRFVLTDCLWIALLYAGAYFGFRHSDLK